MKRINKYWEFIKFSAVGVWNTLFSFGVYTVLSVLGVYFLTASAIGYLSGILMGYFINATFVFKKQKNAASAIKYFFVYLFSFFINLSLMYVWVTLLLLNQYVAQFLTVAVTMLVNYFLSRSWVFGGIQNGKS